MALDHIPLALGGGLGLLKHLSDRLTIAAAAVTVKCVPKYSISLDQLFQALADPTRRAMIERLIRGPASVSQLAAPLSMSLPAAMQHLQVLEACGLVRSEKLGRVRTCQIVPDGLRVAEDWIGAQRTAWEGRLDRLGEYLAGESEPSAEGSK